jgi:hypothetical protein
MAKTFFKKKNKRADSVRKRGVLNKGGIGRNVFNKKALPEDMAFFMIIFYTSFCQAGVSSSLIFRLPHVLLYY